MRTPVFLSVSRPQDAPQERFLARTTAALAAHGLAAHTVGVTESCQGSPLPAIRRLMTEVQGLVVVAFRRTRATQPLQGWQTSVFCQLEMAMAYQRGLPILVVRERGVVTEGMLDAVPDCCYTPEFDLEEGDDCDRVLIESYLLADWSARLRGAQHVSSGA